MSQKMEDYLHPSVLSVFLASIGIAYVVGRLIRGYYERREANKPKPSLSRAERRRQMRGQK
jgi:hypothetical protein